MLVVSLKFYGLRKFRKNSNCYNSKSGEEIEKTVNAISRR